MIIILYFATVALSLTGLRQNEDKYSEFYNKGYQITNRVMNMRRGLQIIVKDIAFITIDENAEKSETYWADIEKELDLMSENGNWLHENYEGERALLEVFEDSISRAITMQEEVVKLANTDSKKAQ